MQPIRKYVTKHYFKWKIYISDWYKIPVFLFFYFTKIAIFNFALPFEKSKLHHWPPLPTTISNRKILICLHHLILGDKNSVRACALRLLIPKNKTKYGACALATSSVHGSLCTYRYPKVSQAKTYSPLRDLENELPR